jgi:hypothetical protein
MLLAKGNWLTVMQLEQNMCLIAITYLRSIGFKVGELNQLSYLPNQGRYRWNEIILFCSHNDTHRYL